MMYRMRRRAFTLIELMIVIVVMGIVAGITLETIRQYYDGIYRTAEYTKRVSTADHVLEQLTKYFENAISVSIVNMDVNNTFVLGTGICNGPPQSGDLSDYTIAFIGVDEDSLRGTWSGTRYVPGWNEDVNISGAVMTQVGGDYTRANTIITALGSTLGNSAVYNNAVTAGNSGACNDFNWDSNSTSTKYLTINNSTASTLTMNQTLSDENKKRAYLLRTGYAFRVLDNGNLMMYTNFRPWVGQRYNVNGTAYLMAENVAHIYADYNAVDYQNNVGLNDRGMVWRLKVCMRGINQDLSESNASANDICRERRVHVRY